MTDGVLVTKFDIVAKLRTWAVVTFTFMTVHGRVEDPATIRTLTPIPLD